MRIRPSTLAIVAAVALVFSGLALAQRSLRQFEQGSQRADAQGIAAGASAFLQGRASALNSLHGLFLSPDERPDSVRFALLIASLREHLDGFHRVWVADSAGILLLQEQLVAGGVPSLPIGTDVDTLPWPMWRLVEEARRTRRTQVMPPRTTARGDSVIAIVEPVVFGGVVRGVIGGGFPLSQLRNAMLADAASGGGRAELLLLADHRPADSTAAPRAPARLDTVLVTGAHEQRQRRQGSMHPVPLPGGGQWYLGVYHAADSPVRVQLWGVALAALGALVAGAWHERRQSRRIADRSRELEHLSEELLRANRAKSEFLANVSHELRTPLNAIVGFTELLRDGVYGELSPRQAGPVQRIEASASHLRALVDQVLDLAKITAGRLEVNRELVNMRQVLLDIGTEMEPLFAERGLSFSLNLGAAVPRVRTDPVHLRQILVNLLGNAVKFTAAGGVVVRTRLVAQGGEGPEPREPRTSGAFPSPAAAGAPAVVPTGWVSDGAALRAAAPDPQAAWVVVQVIDSGPGIAEADHARIFDEFEQVNAGSRGDSEHRGTGLGLPISRRLAHLLGGDLTVESVPGRGSAFTLWLPVE